MFELRRGGDFGGGCEFELSQGGDGAVWSGDAVASAGADGHRRCHAARCVRGEQCKLEFLCAARLGAQGRRDQARGFGRPALPAESSHY